MKKFTLVFSILCCLLCVHNAHSQKVFGFVVDSLGHAVTDVVVIDLLPIDKASSRVTVTDTNGRFEFKSISIPYKLLFQHISYQDHTAEDTVNNLGKIVMKQATETIAEVIVKGERPTIKVEQRKLVYDIRRLSEGKVVKNAYEAIAELPAIRDNNGNLEIMGATQGTTVIINGKPSVMSQGQLMDFMKSTPVDRLEKVETSYNAPPQWHVVGAAINIVIKREQNDIKAQLQANYSRSEYNSYEEIANMYVAGKKFSADFMAGHRDFIAYDKTIEQSRHQVLGQVYNIDQVSKFKGHGNKINLYGSLGYKLKAEKSLSLSYYSEIQPSLRETYNTRSNYFSANQANNKSDGSFHGVSLAYESDKVSAGISYSYLGNNYMEKLGGDTLNYNSNTDNTVHYLGVYVDAQHTIQKTWTLSYGAKINYVENKSKQRSEPAVQVSDMTLNECTANAYVDLGHTFKGGASLSVTLLGEYYTIENYHKFNFLPNLSLSYPISDNHAIQFSFSLSKDMPSYSMQLERISYMDAYKVQIGNPAIRPALVYSTNLSYILKNKYIFSFSHTYVSDNIQNQWFMDPEKLQMVQQPLNIDFASVATLSIHAPFNVGKFWLANFTILGSQFHFKAKNWHGLSYNTSQWGVISSFNNTFRVSKKPKISLSLNAYYSAPSLMGIYKTSTTWYVNAGANYAFIKDKAILNISCNDIFQSGRNIRESIVEGQYQYFKSRFYARTLNISLTYKFGGYKDSPYHNSNMGTDRL